MSVIGLDLSLTSTGVAALGARKRIDTFTIKSTGKKDAPVVATVRRLREIVSSIGGYAFNYQPKLAVIEGPSYGSNTGSQHERGGLWWLVAQELWNRDIRLAVVPPQSRAKYATGKGNASKDEVLAAVVKQYDQANVTGNDVADAVVLFAMGMRWIGKPVDPWLDSKPAHLAAMNGARWP